MQLPFVCRVLPDTPIVPIVMGSQTLHTIEALAADLVRALAGRRALLVASSDLSHYFDVERAAGLDAHVVDYIDRFDTTGLLDKMQRYPEAECGRFVACGGGPMVCVIRAAQALGATRSSVLKRGDSGDVSGDKTQVVGYLAAVIGR